MGLNQVHSLEEVSRDRNNNLNILRFLAASMVVFGHAYPLGNGTVDPLGRITSYQMNFGYLGVCIFFFFGGFFISKSMCRIRKAGAFFKARCIRIFPCLAVVVVASAFVLGPLLSRYGAAEYFASSQTYRYLLNAILVPVHNLPGVFEGNISGQAVNGALWTLPVEFLCYIACYMVFRLGLLNERKLKYTIPFFVVGYILMWHLLSGITVLQSAVRPCGMFYVGMLYYIYRDKIKIRFSSAIFCLLGTVLSLFLGIQEMTVLLFLPYLLAYIVFGTAGKASGFGKRGEISYGLYLCAYPIQQMVTWGFGGEMEPVLNFVISWPLAVVGGMLLWRGVERRLG